MKSSSINRNELKKKSKGILKPSDYCKVSKASNEIMLDRFYNGNNIDFPFQNI